MVTRVSYPLEIKMKAIEMRMAGVPLREVMEELGIKNETQLRVWMKWIQNGDTHRLEQPVEKQYSYNKGPEYTSELEKLKVENRFLKQQVDVLKNTRSWKGGGTASRDCLCRGFTGGSNDHSSMCMAGYSPCDLLPLEGRTRGSGRPCGGEDPSPLQAT